MTTTGKRYLKPRSVKTMAQKKKHQKFKEKPGKSHREDGRSIYILAVLAILFAVGSFAVPEVSGFIVTSLSHLLNIKHPVSENNTTSLVDPQTEQIQTPTSIIPKEIADFTPTYQKTLSAKKIFLEGRRIAPIELLPQNNVTSNHSVRVYMFDNFLSSEECDGLRTVHDKHVRQGSKQSPILCFESLQTLRLNLRSVEKAHVKVSTSDFTKGTYCLNVTFSEQVAGWLRYNWSHSTAFYPGESTFSKKMAALIQETTSLKKENGGKFQITSYPQNIGYKKHTDCMEDNSNLKDRMATILVYLDDVESGGETSFTDLGIWVKPKKGRALVWNNMNEEGHCDLASVHQANKVFKGHKYILQRWYYYESFWSLGRRLDAPSLPQRDAEQGMVLCDEYQHGSCRWYDEWSYDVMEDYRHSINRV